MKKLILLMSVLFFIVSCEKDTVVYTLTTSASPADGGTVTPSTKEFNDGDVANLVATPSAEYLFKDWTGATGTNETTLIIDSDKTVVANFIKKQYALTTVVVGEGTVTEKVIKAGAATDYNSGTVVELTATPASGWAFKEWTGDMTGTDSPKNITVSSAKTVTAVFVKMMELAIVTDLGTCVGCTITKTPDALAYIDGTVVTLTASIPADWAFENWSGGVTGTNSTIDITMSSDATVIGKFKSTATVALDLNGNLKAKEGAVAGDTQVINGETYTVLDDDLLKEWVSTLSGKTGTTNGADDEEKDLSKGVTTLCTNMKDLFKNNTNIEADISAWDVSKVTTMEGMFEGATNFNQDISKWQTNKVTNMDRMFKGASIFYQDISKWCVVNFRDASTGYPVIPTDFSKDAGDFDSEVYERGKLLNPVWGYWLGVPLKGDWEMVSWTPTNEDGTARNGTDDKGAGQFDNDEMFKGKGAIVCETNPDIITIDINENYTGTYKITLNVCFTDGSQPFTDIANGFWAYVVTENGYEGVITGDKYEDVYKDGGQSEYLRITYTSDYEYFTITMKETDSNSEAGNEEYYETEVWKRRN
jgi:surface protein|tara:strand:+ start:422 stop:2188 length:1767 start_codon:yes stop_codon:yes gene_type:complete